MASAPTTWWAPSPIHANIPGHTIGAIRIQEDRTLVDVPQQYVTQVLDKGDAYRIRKHVVRMERMAE